MFEIDQYDAKKHRETPIRSGAAYAQPKDIEKMSLLFWGEHCTECAAPACYQTCDLFEARPDTRCRRFQFGVYKNSHFQTIRGYGAEVAFKKWGVFAAMGNTSMVSRRSLMWQERLLSAAAPILNAVGPIVGKLTKDERWTYPTFGLSRRFCAWLHRRNQGKTKPDAFVLEVFNPDEPLQVQLAMDYTPEIRKSKADLIQIQPRFRTTLTLPRGYSHHEFERRLFQSFTESALPFNISIVPEADTSPRLVFLTADFVTYSKKRAIGQPPAGVKCVVWDLDNTLWHGTLVEDDEVKLRENVKEIIQALDRRGILCSIASKNDHESAWRRIEAFGLAEYFLVPQINWNPKSENVKTIATRLNIGVDSLAFVDDNPFELTEVGRAIPEVMCINVKDLDQLATGDRFQGSTTADAQNRRRYYQEAIVREDKQAEFGDDYRHFLEYCEIKLEIRAYGDEDFDRAAELIQRTNQLNFSGRKYGRDELREILGDAELGKYILYCSDRFGSYGLIGFGMVRPAGDEIHVQDLMLSCRVQGKLIEQAFFSHLETEHNGQNARTLRVLFKETKRNMPARQALEAAGFTIAASGAGYERAIRTPDAKGPVQVTCASCNNVPSRPGDEPSVISTASGARR